MDSFIDELRDVHSRKVSTDATMKSKNWEVKKKQRKCGRKLEKSREKNNKQNVRNILR
jgi:hypothetical protein